jgi:hypothetical protein
MADRRDLRRSRPPVGRPVFHFDIGPRLGRQDHDDMTPYTDFVDHVDDHEDHEDHVDDHDDEGAFWDGHHNDAAGTDRLFDRLESLLQSLEQRVATRQQRLEKLVEARLRAVEAEADRVVRELGDHVHELRRRVDDATDPER